MLSSVNVCKKGKCLSFACGCVRQRKGDRESEKELQLTACVYATFYVQLALWLRCRLSRLQRIIWQAYYMGAFAVVLVIEQS